MYAQDIKKDGSNTNIVELGGIEPPAFRMPSERSLVHQIL